MSLTKKYLGDLFVPARFYWAMGSCIALYVVAFFYPPLMVVPQTFFYLLIALTVIDYLFLFIAGDKPDAERLMAERFSNGDENKITLRIQNNKPFPVFYEIIDELPVQFQERNWQLLMQLKARQERSRDYYVRPVERGEYQFGNILLYESTGLGLLQRRHTIEAETTVPVYPSFMQLRKYELMSQTTIQAETGNKRVRRLGHSMEFEQIKEYVNGDDIRTINWKAVARKSNLMVNTFTDEKSQQVYCIIDKGRLMKMPFNGLSLLDYAINSTLVLSNVCLQKQDKVGLITFANKMGNLLPADRKAIQKASILQMLYNQETSFPEADYEMLYLQLRNRIKQRSLLVLFTNFESMSGLRRQLPYLRSIARHHLLMVVFFENTELTGIASGSAETLEAVYLKAIAEKFAHEKRLIVKELQNHGILSVLTPPEKLTVNAINKYLELKARQLT